MSGGETPSPVPAQWCNFVFDFPQYAVRDMPAVSLNRGGGRPGDGARRVSVVPQQPLALARQSYNTTDPHIPIPEPLLHLYRLYRPTPLQRARRLERNLGANARIYYKFEGANISGSHKLNTALAQAYYYGKAGVEHLVTGTGAGQWGTAVAYACKIFGLDCTVFMVGSSLRQKPQRAAMMRIFGASVHESPTTVTKVGRQARERDPERTGTLAVATGEALEFARGRRRTRFAVGSGENCILLHQTVIGSEAVQQMAALGDFPDYVVASMGAGSNFGGVGLPFLRAAGGLGRRVRLLGVESSACPRLTRGKYAFDRNDFSGTTPISKMYTLGSEYIPPPVYAGGLRYHGCSPFLSAMYADGVFDAVALDQLTVLRSGLLFSETECILPAPESAHAVAGAIDLAGRRPRDLPPIVILINISGHGLLDTAAYERYQAGELDRGEPDEKLLSASLHALDEFNASLGVPAPTDQEPQG
jgi:tryptophan synthase beta chain